MPEEEKFHENPGKQSMQLKVSQTELERLPS